MPSRNIINQTEIIYFANERRAITMKTICAIATGNSAGGIGVIRISGENAIEVADRVFTAKDGSPLARLDGYRAKFGSVIIDNRKSDDAVALVFRAPKSYTAKMLLKFRFTAVFLLLKKLWRLFSAQVQSLPRRANLQSVRF